MASVPKVIQKLIEAFERLPGIGPKTAQRLTYYLLQAPKEESQALASAATDLKEKTVVCEICFNIAEDVNCWICSDSSRDKTIIAVVEDPLDVLALEKTNFKGLYHVLNGSISPMENIGPEELKIRQILPRIKAGEVKEVILATNPTMEGEATAMYIDRLIAPLGIKVTRIARGLPVGGDLEYADETTLRRSMEGRKEY
ncbi:MAG: recombination mediator RecR [Candidatus Daviesbacteria bacterium]|nr:recombination mediator RecR [Candidatus Daviesbacteria bacterium]